MIADPDEVWDDGLPCFRLGFFTLKRYYENTYYIPWV